MSLDMAYLKKCGCSSEQYKRIFSNNPNDWPPKIKRLVNQISARLRDGRLMNLEQWKAYAAIDMAYKVPFRQTTPTLVNHILSQHLDKEGTLAALKEWGLDQEELFMSIPTKGGGTMQQMNIPVFFRVVPTLVKAYTSAIAGKLFNARNQSPLLPYRPRKETEHDQLQSEIVTDLVDDMAMNLGYAAHLRAMIEQTLRYGVMLAFPREEWYWEWQRISGGKIDEKGNDRGRKVTVKEGIRYIIPDPTRFYYDLKYPLTSVNTNTGCEFMGHWHVMSYGQILDNRDLWNRKSIFAGTNWFQAPMAGQYWKEIYPCKINFPEGMGWEVGTKREDKAGWYTSADRDKSVFVAEHFEKLIPRDWGLGDYDGPVWHRFTVAGDDTIVWAEPCAYTPGIFMGYDYAENVDATSSLSLELIPWQDWLGNLLSQILLTAKQNLLKVIMVDKQQIDPEEVRQMRNIGEDMYRGLQFIWFDSLANRAAMTGGESKAFHPVQFPITSVQELMQILPVFLNIMERVLMISAQQAGGAGPHYQGKKEIEAIGEAGSNRLTYIGASIDEGTDAWRQQLYDGAVNYADTNFVAEVDADTPELETLLSDMGFKIADKGKAKVIVKGNWQKMRLLSFARTGEGTQSATDMEASAQLRQLVGTLVGAPEMFKKVGTRNVMAILQESVRLGGGPKDFRLREAAKPEKDDEIEPNVQEAIQKGISAALQAVEEKIGRPAAQKITELEGQMQQLSAALKALEGIAQTAQQLANRENVKAQDAQAKIQIRTQEAQAEQQRKDAALQAEERRKDEAAAAELRRKEEAAQLDAHLKSAAHNVDQSLSVAKSQTEQEIAQAEAAAKQAQASKEPAES